MEREIVTLICEKGGDDERKGDKNETISLEYRLTQGSLLIIA